MAVCPKGAGHAHYAANILDGRFFVAGDEPQLALRPQPTSPTFPAISTRRPVSNWRTASWASRLVATSRSASSAKPSPCLASLRAVRAALVSLASRAGGVRRSRAEEAVHGLLSQDVAHAASSRLPLSLAASAMRFLNSSHDMRRPRNGRAESGSGDLGRWSGQGCRAVRGRSRRSPREALLSTEQRRRCNAVDARDELSAELVRESN